MAQSWKGVSSQALAKDTVLSLFAKVTKKDFIKNALFLVYSVLVLFRGGHTQWHSIALLVVCFKQGLNSVLLHKKHASSPLAYLLNPMCHFFFNKMIGCFLETAHFLMSNLV